tara:strand:- start:839 stop:1171 length:333 start_codon:yes stop_codon:yes gene_type:complete
MEKKVKSKEKERETTTLEIIYNDKEDLIELSNKEEFKQFVLEDSLKTIKIALEKKLKTVELFNVFNLSLVVELDKSNYKSVLNNITQHYINEEDYEKCSEIQDIIIKYEI